MIRKCIVCKHKNLIIINKKKKSLESASNINKVGVNFILNNDKIEIIDLFECKRCRQQTLIVRNRDSNKIEKIWLEYLSKSKLIEKELLKIEQAIKNLKNLDKDNDVLNKKAQLLSQSYEVFRLKKDSLKHTMMASISIKIQSALV